MSLLDLSIKELRNKIDNKEITAQELVQESVDRITELDPKLNSFITFDTDYVKSQVTDFQENQLLSGIPVALKDNIVTRDLATTCGSKMLENFTDPLYDATVAERLRTAGSINMGKLNMDEFAMGSSNESSYFGPVHNPYHLDYVPGGSSGGSAAAVAAGLVKAALGSDTGGSVRQPAAFTNTVGLKPTYGRISRFGVVAFASSLDQIGIFSKTVEDNAVVLEAIAGRDEMDTTSSVQEVPKFSELLETSMAGKKIAVPVEYMSDAINPEIRERILEAIEVYRGMGAIVETVRMPHLDYVVPAYYIIAPCEASSNLARFDGIRYGYRAENTTDLDNIYEKSRAEGFGSEVKKRILVGTYCLSAGHYDAFYMQAAKLRTVIKQDFDAIFKEYDVILGPTTPDAPFKIGAHSNDAVKVYLNDLLTIPANLVGLPAISVPAGFTKDGLPVGLQLTGKAFDEVGIYQFAHAFEQATKYYQVKPEMKGGN